MKQKFPYIAYYYDGEFSEFYLVVANNPAWSACVLAYSLSYGGKLNFTNIKNVVGLVEGPISLIRSDLTKLEIK